PREAQRMHSLLNTLPIQVRPLDPGDRAHVEAGFRALGTATIRARFLGLVKASPRLFSWVDELDGRERIAVGASHGDTGAPLGLARCVRDADDPSRAEVAVTVIDEWQGRGIGTALMAELASRAAAEGVTTFAGTVFADNGRARRLAAKLGDACTGVVSRGVVS